MKEYVLNLSEDDYTRFKSHPATRLYVHRRTKDGDTYISSSKPNQLAVDLEKAIDFGATSAREVLNLPPIAPRKTVEQICRSLS